MLAWSSFQTPCGPGAVAESNGRIVRVYLPYWDHGKTRFDAALLHREFPGARESDLESARILARCFEEGAGCAEALLGRVAWPDQPPFFAKVWKECAKVRAGETATYGDLALRVGNPAAGRAVGQAMARNPLPLVVPCHRILAHGDRLGHYGGGLDMKRLLLQREGHAGLRD